MINERKPDFNNSPKDNNRGSAVYERFSDIENPLISIITPFYNTGELFIETANSIFGQSLQQFEWLIINDGSIDQNSISILKQYENVDNRVKVIHHESNQGLSSARNTGIKHARCEFILFIDSDDLIEPTAAEKWFWFLNTHPIVNFVDSFHVAFGELNYLWTGGFHDAELNLDRNRISMLCMVRKSVFIKVGMFDESIRSGLEDWDFWLKCASYGIWGQTVPEFLAWYRVRNDHSDRWINLNENNIVKFKEVLKNKYPNLYSGDFPKIDNIVDLDLTEIEAKDFNFNLLNKKKKNLLIILPWLVMGGAERFILNLIDQLTNKNWEITIITTAISNNEWKTEFEKFTKDIFILSNFLNLVYYVDFINYLIHSRGIDAVLLQGSIEGYRLLPIIRKTHPALVIVDYIHFITPDWMNGGFPRLSAIHHQFINKSIVSCHQVKNWLVDHQIEPSQVVVCYIGVNPTIWKFDLERRAQVRKKFSIGGDEFILVYAARLEDQKQPFLLLKTLQILKSQRVNVKLLIAGEGSLRSEIEKRISEYGLTENVLMLGSVSADEMPDLLNAGDLFFLPSDNEGISSAIYEAMATGLPVLGANVGGQSELVISECGCLIDKGIVEPEKEYARVIINLYNDPHKRNEMSSSCRNRIQEKFSTDSMGSCINSTLLSLLPPSKENGQLAKEEKNSDYNIKTDQLTLEYLQARNEWIKLNKNQALLLEKYEKLAADYSKLIEPKPPSYWFYLWIRQLFLPIYNKLDKGSISEYLLKLKMLIKNGFKVKS